MKKMKKLFLLFITTTVFCSTVSAQKHDPDLLGNCSLQQLEKSPYAEWYSKNFDAYKPNPEVVDALKKRNLSKYSVQVFFGSWCGDSKRELPKMTRLLEKLSFPQKNISLIGVEDSTELYKQDPARQTVGMNIFRVPTFVIYENNKEIGRIVEYPVETMERDLLQILIKKEYRPNYYCYPQIIQWKKDGLLKDENISSRGLAARLKALAGSESELNACGYVMMAQNDLKEAITVFKINVNLFPQSANCWDSLGEAYAKAGLKENAIQAYEYVLQLNPKSENAVEQLKKLKG
jgi:thiol-disulfide isomerase/thioredoxin